MITNKNNLQCLCVWWFVRSFISNSQSIFFISTSRLLQRIQWPKSSEIYLKKTYRLSFGFVVNQPTPPPLPSPLFLSLWTNRLLGDNCILWCFFSPTARKIGFTHIYSWANMMQTRCKCVANMVNAVFTHTFTSPR